MIKLEKIKKGDNVGRKSYGNDIIFKVEKIINAKGKKIAILKGITERIQVDSNLEDLCIIEKEKINKKLRNLDEKLEKRIAEKEEKTRELETRLVKQFKTGTILHLDGDKRYSEKSLRYYKRIGLKAIVKNIPENRQSKMVYQLLSYYKPDILVITGHDRNDS